MKRVFVLVGILLISAGMLFAAITSVGSSETFEVNLNLSSGGDDIFTPVYKVGFTTDNTEVTADTTVQEADSLDLEDTDTSDVSLVADGTVYVYYQILSNDAVYLTLSGEALTADGESIDWTGTWTPKKSTAEGSLDTGDSPVSLSKDDYSTPQVVYTHTPSVATGSYGSVKVDIETEDASGKAAKDYSATLTLTIKEGVPADGDSQG